MNLHQKPLQLIRLLHINYIIFRNRLDVVILSTSPFHTFSFLRYFNPWYWLKTDDKTRGETIRLTLEQLGPIFVKFGQILSTRRDLLPEDIADELEKLQDCVPPFSSNIAKEILEKEYQGPIEKVFSHFDWTPLASASIAQVHAATLHDGTSVVVKIVRPHIEKLIRQDIGLLFMVASISEKIFSQGKRLRMKELVAEFERSTRYELDLLHEGANASTLRRNFLHSPQLYIPAVFFSYSTKNVLVMERIQGIPISDIDTLKQYQIDLKALAERGVEIFFTQVLRDSFFHADMHPGNIFVNKTAKEPQYIAVDFGIMGTLSPVDQHYLAENLLAFFRRDYRRVAELHVESGWVTQTVRIDAFETAIRGISEPIFERPFKDISLAKLLLKLFQVAREFNMEIQPQFFLLQKTLLNIEGLGRQLYPDLDLWTTAKPYLEKWVRQQLGLKALVKKVSKEGPQLIHQLLEIPHLLHAKLTAQLATTKVDQQVINLETKRAQRKRRLEIGILIFAVASIFYLVMHFFPTQLTSVTLILGILSALFILINLT